MISNKWSWLVALVFFTKACVLAFWVTPLWDIPDETGHFAYARGIYSGKGIPVLGQDVIETDILSHVYGKEVVTPLLNWIAQHPPAYHVLAGLIWKLASFVTDDPELLFRVPRIIAAISGALTLVVLYHLLLLVLSDPLPCLAFASCVGFIPMFSNLASGVNHDTTLTLFVSLATYFWARFLLHGKRMRDAYYAACWLSLSCFTKFTAFVLSAPMLAIIIYEMDSPWKQRIRQTITMWAVWGVFPALWMLWSYSHYRMLLPVAQDVFEFISRAENPLTDSLLQYLSGQPAVESLFTHFFGLFGWIGTGKGECVLLSLTTFELMCYSILTTLFASLAGVYMSRSLLSNRQIIAESHSLADLVCRFGSPINTTKAFGGIAIFAGLLAGFYISHLIFMQHALMGYQFRQIFYGLLSLLAVLGIFSLLHMSSQEVRSVAYVWIVMLFFSAVVIWQLHKAYLFYGALHGLHGRYFFPLIPLMLLGVFISTRSLLRDYAVHLFVLLALVLAYLELHVYLTKVIPFYAQGVAP